MKPLIGITSEVLENGSYFLPPVYAKAIVEAGGIPFLIPLVPNEDLDDLSDLLDGLFVTGGEDIDPGYYKEDPHVNLGKIVPKLDELEYNLVELMLKKDKPYIGVCRGMHMLNIVQGGSLYQHIHTQRKEMSHLHLQIAERTHRSHTVHVHKDSNLYNMLQEEEFRVNSFHHQALNKIGKDLEVVAHATDGIVEAVESKSHSFVHGFQWHPEEFAVDGEENSKRVFSRYIEAAIERKNRDQK
ncbi:gamma-glutamyl-gamma-aminobutyrate hydrolase family protein [Paenisporosarcina cavernae]|uniref:Gamma-glutamyl-gamma-aminobutyrate hydrolase family protein n=1 Tax=Paenisporosarcina cavernae TaxID=2320858 RepID=A0A385YV32_9BACL|nr:gamma-glutamyl-gamma-aminobutyrate hydrolase family protein [Paenisporosarcina cavernae]